LNFHSSLPPKLPNPLSPLLVRSRAPSPSARCRWFFLYLGTLAPPSLPQSLSYFFLLNPPWSPPLCRPWCSLVAGRHFLFCIVPTPCLLPSLFLSRDPISGHVPVLALQYDFGRLPFFFYLPNFLSFRNEGYPTFLPLRALAHPFRILPRFRFFFFPMYPMTIPPPHVPSGGHPHKHIQHTSPSSFFFSLVFSHGFLLTNPLLGLWCFFSPYPYFPPQIYGSISCPFPIPLPIVPQD